MKNFLLLALIVISLNSCKKSDPLSLKVESVNTIELGPEYHDIRYQDEFIIRSKSMILIKEVNGIYGTKSPDIGENRYSVRFQRPATVTGYTLEISNQHNESIVYVFKAK